MERAREDSSMEFGKSQEQKGGYSGSTKRQQESPLCHIGGHMSPQECGVGTEITEVKRQSRAPGGHCKKTTLEPTQFFPHRARLRPR